MRVCPRCHARYDDDSRFCPRDGAPLPASEGDPRIGTVLFGQFELLEVCGRGAMGTVYRAWQMGMDRQVAVKVLRAELLRDPGVVKRFHREARAVARIQHPNIVTVFLVGETDDGLPYIVMEYVDGEVLAETISRDQILPTERALRIARQVTSALADAHAEGIVHRDLKPANILITQRRRASDFVKVLDFGIAKILRGELGPGQIGGESHLTRSGTIFGTPHYIAPEQAAGADVDHRADLYSLGVILYRMLTGQLPFEGTGIAVVLAHVQRVPPRPREVRPDMDPRVEALILRALAKDPAQRFQSAEEFSDAIDALLRNSPQAGMSWASWTAAPPAGTSNNPLPLTTVKGLAPVPTLVDDEEEHHPTRRAGSGAAMGGMVATVVDPTPTPPPVTPHAPLIAPPSRSYPGGVPRAAEASVDPPLYLDSDGSESWRPPRTRTRTAVIAGLIAVLCAGGAAAGAYLLGRSSGAPASAGPAGAAAPATAPATGGPSKADPATTPANAADAGTAAPPIAWRIVTIGEAGFAIRVLMPPRIDVDADVIIAFEVLEPSGRPLPGAELRLSIEEPGGIERKLVAPRAGEPGRFELRRRFSAAGRYHLHVHPDAARPDMHVWCEIDVVAPGVVLPPVDQDHGNPTRTRTRGTPTPVDPATPPHTTLLPPAADPDPVPPAAPDAAPPEPYHMMDDPPPDAGDVELE